MARLDSLGVSARYQGVANMNTPWWYSGDESADEGVPLEGDPREGDPREGDPASAPAWDPNALLMAASQIVDWATERFVVPHAEHVDPGDHPTCVLCRSAAVLGGRTAEPNASTDPSNSTPMTWIPVRRIDPEE